LNLKKSALRRTKKKLHQRVLTEWFEKHFEKKTSFYLASQKKEIIRFGFIGTYTFLLNAL